MPLASGPDCRTNHRQCRIGFLDGDQMRNPAHAVAMRTQIAIALGVCGDGVIHAMLPAVHFDDKFVLLAVKIGSVWADRRLPPELQSIELTIAEALP